MPFQTEHVYYNPLDRRCWKAIALGLPLLLVAIVGLAVVGWWVRGHTTETAPVTWLRHPWFALALALLGGFTLSLIAGIAWTVGLIAHAVGRTIIDVSKMR